MWIHFTICFVIIIFCESKYIDLTHNYDNTTTIYWPTCQHFRFRLYIDGRVDTDKMYYESNRFCAAEHGGTHVDAPRHFVKGKQGAHEISLDSLIGDAYVVDVSHEAKNNRDLQVNIMHIEAIEKKLGKIPDDSILLIYTGFSQYWPDLNLYLGTNTTNASLLHFPGLHPIAAQWLVDSRKIKSFGIDTPSLDYGQSTTFKSHVILLGNNIPGFENVNMKPLADENMLESNDFQIIALPMKIKDGSGAPLRIIAVTKTKVTGLASQSYSILIVLVLITIGNVAFRLL